MNCLTSHVDNGQVSVDMLCDLSLRKYDFMQIDLQMHVMDGFEATKYIKEFLQLDITIYALTGESRKSFQQQ